VSFAESFVAAVELPTDDVAVLAAQELLVWSLVGNTTTVGLETWGLLDLSVAVSASMGIAVASCRRLPGTVVDDSGVVTSVFKASESLVTSLVGDTTPDKLVSASEALDLTAVILIWDSM
jgi:hypothetical protein